MMVFISWIKKNTKTIVFVLAMIGVLILTILAFWLKIRGFKVTDLLSKLQIAEAKNEIGHLEVKKAILKKDETNKVDEIKELDAKIKEESKKMETIKLQVKGLNNEQIASELSSLGY